MENLDVLLLYKIHDGSSVLRQGLQKQKRMRHLISPFL